MAWGVWASATQEFCLLNYLRQTNFAYALVARAATGPTPVSNSCASTPLKKRNPVFLTGNLLIHKL